MKQIIQNYWTWISGVLFFIAMIPIECALFSSDSKAFSSYILWAFPLILVGMIVMFSQTYREMKEQHQKEWAEMRARHYMEGVELHLWRREVERVMRGDFSQW